MSLTTTREFRWDDPGAPTLNGTVGSFYALMKACLVGSGGIAYGSGAQAKPAAGWSIAFDDPGAQKIVFRNSMAHGGSGCYVQIVDDGTASNGARVAAIMAYESMTDIDTGVYPARDAVTYIRKSNTLDTTPREWVIYCDERKVHFKCRSNANNTRSQDRPGVHFGDMRLAVPGDPSVFISGTGVASSSGTNGDGLSSYFPQGEYDGIYLSRRASDLAPIPTQCSIRSSLSTTGTSANGGEGAGGTRTASASASMPGLGGPALMPSVIFERAGALRGLMPGVLVPLNLVVTNTGGWEFIEPVTPILVASTRGLRGIVSGTPAAYVIDLDDWVWD